MKAAEAIIGYKASSNCAQKNTKALVFQKKGVITESNLIIRKVIVVCPVLTVCERCVWMFVRIGRTFLFVVPGMEMAQIVHISIQCATSAAIAELFVHMTALPLKTSSRFLRMTRI
jgi:hypothetical protein